MSNGRYSYANAAAKILADAGNPLHVRDIARIAIERDMLQSTRMVHQNMNATLQMASRGVSSRFAQESPDVYWLRGWPREPQDGLIREQAQGASGFESSSESIGVEQGLRPGSDANEGESKPYYEHLARQKARNEWGQAALNFLRECAKEWMKRG